MPKDAESGVREDEPESRDVPFEGPPEEDEARVHGNKAVAELGAEAKPKQHVYTHRPKNPYCDVCNRSKILKHRWFRGPYRCRLRFRQKPSRTRD